MAHEHPNYDSLLDDTRYDGPGSDPERDRQAWEEEQVAVTAPDQVYRLRDVWQCVVDGKVYGDWSDRGAAVAGMQTEQRRARERARR